MPHVDYLNFLVVFLVQKYNNSLPAVDVLTPSFVFVYVTFIICPVLKLPALIGCSASPAVSPSGRTEKSDWTHLFLPFLHGMRVEGWRWRWRWRARLLADVTARGFRAVSHGNGPLKRKILFIYFSFYLLCIWYGGRGRGAGVKGGGGLERQCVRRSPLVCELDFINGNVASIIMTVSFNQRYLEEG